MMWSYAPPLRDMQFVMDELLEVRKDWADIPAFSDLDADTAPQILEAATYRRTSVRHPETCRKPPAL